MQITKVSQATGVEHTREIQINPDDYYYWEAHRGMAGGFIQDAFPSLSADDREFLISGTTPEEWDDLFGDIEEDEESDYTEYPQENESGWDWPDSEGF
jgi:hypothetical protein